MRHYLAYGSNLHPLRIIERVSSSRLVGIARLERYDVTFVKRSVDGSAKCNLLFTDDVDDVAYAAIYQISESQKHLLDKAEGLGHGYEETTFEMNVNDAALSCFAYIAASSHLDPALVPYDWYKALVIEGARYHRFPKAYIDRLDRTECLPDPDAERSLRNADLLIQIRNYERQPAHDPD